MIRKSLAKDQFRRWQGLLWVFELFDFKQCGLSNLRISTDLWQRALTLTLMSGKPFGSFGTFAEAFAACSAENSCFPSVPIDMLVDVLLLDFSQGNTQETSVDMRT